MRNAIHVISLLLLLASLVIWIQGCTESEFQDTREALITSSGVVDNINKIIPPAAGTFDLKFFLASLAAILELAGGIAGGIIVQKKISNKNLAIKQVVAGIHAIKVLYPEFYPTIKACQFATQTGETPAIVAKMKAVVVASGDIFASPIDPTIET